MKRNKLLHMSLAAFLLVAGCGGGGDAASGDAGETGIQASNRADGNVVTEVIQAGKYTYVEVKHNDETLWAAAPQFDVEVGDEVVLPPDMMPMQNWHSKTLDRTWDVVYFASSINTAGGGHAQDQTAYGGSDDNGDLQEALDFSGITHAEGGQTVSELYSQRQALDGQGIKIRGMVVKVTKNVMGKNWIHIQDGTGAPGANDLTVTTQAFPQVGDTVLVTGDLHTDMDFGAGYYFDIIVEDAEVTVQ